VALIAHQIQSNASIVQTKIISNHTSFERFAIRMKFNGDGAQLFELAAPFQ